MILNGTTHSKDKKQIHQLEMLVTRVLLRQKWRNGSNVILYVPDVGIRAFTIKQVQDLDSFNC